MLKTTIEIENGEVKIIHYFENRKIELRREIEEKDRFLEIHYQLWSENGDYMSTSAYCIIPQSYKDAIDAIERIQDISYKFDSIKDLEAISKVLQKKYSSFKDCCQKLFEERQQDNYDYVNKNCLIVKD